MNATLAKFKKGSGARGRAPHTCDTKALRMMPFLSMMMVQRPGTSSSPSRLMLNAWRSCEEGGARAEGKREDQINK